MKASCSSQVSPRRIGRLIHKNSFPLVTAVTAILCGGSTSMWGQASSQALFDIPAAAYHTRLGDLRPQESVPIAPSYMVAEHFSGVADSTTASADRGIALGGVGAGSFEINQAGSFGPWYFGGGSHEWRVLPQAAFHIREQRGDEVKVHTLAVNGVPAQRYEYVNNPKPMAYTPHVMEKWPTIAAGEATYDALYPFGWLQYKAGSGAALQTEVAIRFWSPIVARDDERTSMPAGYFDVRLRNPTAKPVTVSIMFTFPNAPVHVGGVAPANWLFGQPDTREMIGGKVSTRSAFTSGYRVDESTGVHAVTLGATGVEDTPDAKDSDWTIGVRPATGQKVSYVTSWNANGDGMDILKAFTASADLPDGQIDDSHSAGAIAVSVTLAAGQSTVIPMILAWDFPHDVYSGGGGGDPRRGPPKMDKTSVWMRRYTNFFGAKEDEHNNYIPGSYAAHQGFAIADRLLKEHDRNLADVTKWWRPIAENVKVPLEIRKAALNQLFNYAVNSSFWEGGLVSNTVSIPGGGSRVGTDIPGTHLFSIADGGDGGDETLKNADVDPYTFLATNLIFPSLERDYLRGLTEGVLRSDQKSVGTGTVGTPPYLKVGSEGPNISHNNGYLFRVWAYYKLNQDEAFFRYAYPAMVKLYAAEKTRYSLDTQVLPTGNQTSHDLLPVYGSGVLPSTHWLLTLDVIRAASEEAIRLKIPGVDPATAADASAKFNTARAAFESQLWDDKSGHYKFDTGNERVYDGGLYPEATFNQHLAEVVGLPDLMDRDHLIKQLNTVWAGAVQPFKDEKGHLVGAIDLLSTDGKIFGTTNPALTKAPSFAAGAPPGMKFPAFLSGTMEAREFWPGTGFDVAAVMIHDGERFRDASLIARGKLLATDIAYQLWDANRGYAFQAPDGNAQVLNAPTDTDGDVPVAISTTKLNPDAHRNLSYARPLSVWDALVAIDPATLKITTIQPK